MRTLKFGIDVDGVLRDLVGGILFIYNSKFRKNVSREDFIHYDVNDQFPDLPNAYDFFFKGDTGEYLLANSQPIQDSLNAFNILKELGTVYIITSQHGYDNVRYTLEWLHKNRFDTDQICFVKDKSIISGLDYFIDDNPEKFIGNDCTNGILIDMPYNRYDMSEIREKCNCKTFTRYKNLADFTQSLINNLKL